MSYDELSDEIERIPQIEEEEEEEYDDSNQKFDQLNDEIYEYTNKIKKYYVDIKRTLYRIQKTQDNCEVLQFTIKSLQAAPPVTDTLSEQSSRASGRSGYNDEQILPKHQLKLDGKMKEIRRVHEEISQNQVTVASLEDRLRMLLNDECEIQQNMTHAESEIREFQAHSEINRRQSEFIKSQIKERKKEIHQLRILKADAEEALSKLNDREKKCMLIDDQNAQERAIASLQDELVKLETEIQTVRRRMYEFREYSNMQSLQYQSDIQCNENSANWEEEKQTLKNTLNEMKQKVRILKQHQVYYVSEEQPQSDLSKTGSLSLQDRDIYGMICRRWNREAGDEPYEGKIVTAWRQIQDQRVLLAKLMEENVKKTKHLNRRKDTLQLAVDKFRKRENELAFDSQKRAREFELTEKKMIEKIRKLKLKLAQIRLNNESQ